jgi:hypothetical protein
VEEGRKKKRKKKKVNMIPLYIFKLDSPLLVALVGAGIEGEMHACLFSSENGAWSVLTSALIDYIYQLPPDYSTTSCITIDNVPAALLGNELYFIGDFGNEILRCDLVGENLAVVDPLDVETCYDGVVVMPEENGRLGFAFVKANSLHLWLITTTELAIANGLSPPV